MSSLFEELLIYDRIYGYCLIDGRHEDVEELISTNVPYSYHFAVDVINGRFELAEELITTSSEYSYIVEKYYGNMYEEFLF